ncbi:MAG TPA: M50 family metallopeptidase [Gemmatimonadaceae bacterium]
MIPPDVPAIPHVERDANAPTRPHGSTATQLKQAFIGLLVGGAGAACAILFARMYRHAGRSAVSAPTHSLPVIVATLVALTLLVLFIHEGGHALFAWTAGMPMVIMWCGPFMITTYRRVRVRLNPVLGLAGGAVLCAPTSWRGRRDFVPRMTRFVAGGPLTSLITGALAFAILFATESSTPRAMGWGRFLIAIFGLLSIGIGAVTSLPLKPNGLTPHDGAKFRWLRRDARNEEEPVLPFLALSLLAQRQRPNEWADDLVLAAARWTEALPPQYKMSVHLSLHQRAVDTDDVSSAARHLNDALQAGALPSTPLSFWQMATMEAALFELIVRGSLDAGERWLKSASAEKHDPVGHALVDAGRALIAGDRRQAGEHLAHTRRLMDDVALPSVALTRQRYVELILAAIDAR